ncbi:MAG TPA: hypothetical protein VGN93_13300 [Shinella sp.]|jgi:hypothetical protein|uniref:hypothetical protein n=1 Tax=Shinella sp. TaxID=1870904 RepID=UPI002E147F53|nr:hypothetical protein [Shinella sp.]
MKNLINELRVPGERYRLLGGVGMSCGFFAPMVYLDKDYLYKAFGTIWTWEWLAYPHVFLALANMLIYVHMSDSSKQPDAEWERPVMYRAISFSAFIWWSCWLAAHLKV